MEPENPRVDVGIWPISGITRRGGAQNLMLFDKTYRPEVSEDVLAPKDATEIVGLVRGLSMTFPNKLAIISPANSLGFMDGGVEKAYMTAIPSVQDAVYEGIRLYGLPSGLKRPHLPVGVAMAFNPPGEKFLFVSVPTMFLPGDVSKTNNARRATEAAAVLLEALGCGSAVCSLMCTGYGRMAPTTAVEQMRTGWSRSDIHSGRYSITKSECGRYVYCKPPEDVLSEIRRNQPQDYMLQEFVELFEERFDKKE